MKPVQIGLLGCGTVGSGLVELVAKNRSIIADRSGLDLQIRRVLVRDPKKERPVAPELLTTDPAQILDAKDIDVVVELIGGLEPARGHILRAIGQRKHVVTANKMLLAASGSELFRRAAEQRVRIGFEASVCGGIPVLRAIGAGLVANRISAIVGIVNATCNFILTKMGEEHWHFARALVEAQRMGIAEADPTLDLDGQDAAQKLQLLAEMAFGVTLEKAKFLVEGIRQIEDEDILTASQLGFVIKHIAVARDLGPSLELRVHPALLGATHPLAHVRAEANSILVRGDAVTEMVISGRGAGALPTASAVLSDVIEIGRDGQAEHGPAWHLPTRGEKPIAADFESKYYLRLPIKDVPGVIGLITTALGKSDISISHLAATLIEGKPGLGNVKIVAHRTKESALRKAIDEISKLPVLSGRPVVLRIFEEN
jgi:homoserine dehydrogenase